MSRDKSVVTGCHFNASNFYVTSVRQISCSCSCITMKPLQLRHIKHGSVSYHQPHHCLLNRVFRRRSKKTSKVRVTGFCERNSPVTGEFTLQRASNAENVSFWWRHHAMMATHYEPLCAEKFYTQMNNGAERHIKDFLPCHNWKSFGNDLW